MCHFSDLLELLFENSYFSQYGTFLCDSEKEREELGIHKKTTSYWTHLFRPEIMKVILNPLYDPNPGVIWPTVAPSSIVLWTELFSRWTLDQQYRKGMNVMIAEKIEREKELRQKVLKARKELDELRKSRLGECDITAVQDDKSLDHPLQHPLQDLTT